MGGALKVRPKVKSPAWQRRWDDQPFVLRLIREIGCAIHDDPRIETWDGTQEVITEKLASAPLHPAVRKYAEHAIEAYVEVHDAISSEVPGLRFRCFDPCIFPGEGTLTAWACLYENPEGVREIRRLRLDTVRDKPDEPNRWTAVAAHVASLLKPLDSASRIRVVEIGLNDASYQVLFDSTPAESKSTFTTIALPYLERIIAADTFHPGRFCKDCKIAGCCNALESLDGFLGQNKRGASTRSVSARDIELYETCAAQWFLTLSQFLPKRGTHPAAASQRGILVHNWIAVAHSRSIKCAPVDIGDFDNPDTFTSTLSRDEYEEIHPYLTQHVEVCPIGDGAQVISIESPLYGYDASADVIIASTPDMIYVDANECLVIRELKTTSKELPRDNAEAFDRFFASAWLLNLFASGYRGPHQSESARLELEVLAPTEKRVFEWDLKDEGVLRMARREVRHRAKSWHNDTTWEATPGKHCSWCPVRGWCPDATMHGEAQDADLE